MVSLRFWQQMATVLSIFCICYGPLFDRCKHSLSTDDFAELLTGAPQRGHVPVIMRSERSSITEKTKKLGIEKTDWVGWTSFIEGRIEDLMVVGDDPVFLWNEFENLLHDASFGHIPLKCVSNYSKPFWKSDLTDASNKLWFLRQSQVYIKVWEWTKAKGSEGTFQNSTQQKCNWMDGKLSVIAWA